MIRNPYGNALRRKLFQRKSTVTNCISYFFLRRLTCVQVLENGTRRNDMKRIALVAVMIGSLAMAGQASAHGGHGGGRGGNGGAIVGALIGGAVLGALVSSAANAAPVYSQPAYAAQPVYAQPAYAQPVYAAPPPPSAGYCYDGYRRAYVPCY
jgi:hypothetical protein